MELGFTVLGPVVSLLTVRAGSLRRIGGHNRGGRIWQRNISGPLRAGTAEMSYLTTRKTGLSQIDILSLISEWPF